MTDLDLITAAIRACHTEGARADQLAELSDMPHVLLDVDFEKGYDESDPDLVVVDTVDKANAISSKIASGAFAGQHTVAIDLDVPARLVPSSTRGHSHLYIDQPMSWKTYRKLLRALAKAGVVEPGYVKASERRGHTTLRLPWVKKGGASC